MPGFMLHLAEGQMILNKLNRINASVEMEQSNKDCKPMHLKADFIHDFMCGCVIPDATSDKELTHFRPAWQKELITKYPDMDYIMDTYANSMSTACDFGILAHLHLDSLYVCSYWKQHFIFEDIYGTETTVHKDIHHVRLLRNNSRIPYHEFFSTKYFYGDYDILNPYIYKAVHPYIPDVYDIPPEQIHIKECKNYDAGFLADCMKDYVLSDTRPNQPCEINNHTADCYTVNKNTVNKFSQKHADIPLTRIFPYETIFSFLDNTANEYLKLLKKHHFLK